MSFAFDWLSSNANHAYRYARFVCMRTTVDLDEELVRNALEASGARTKTEVIELGLRAVIEGQARRRLIALRGQLTTGQAPRRRRK